MEQGTIKIRASFLFLQWLLYFFKPTVSIDGGEPQKIAWGESTFQVKPGEHRVYVEIPYIFMKIAKADQTVSVGASETVTLRYRPPLIVFMRGKLEPAPS
jgi:hypothetical protein